MKKALLAAALMLAFGTAEAQLQCADTNGTVIVTQKWGDVQRKFSRNFASIGGNDALIIKVQIPYYITPSPKTIGNITGAEWQDGNTLRSFKISNRPCDFGEMGGSSFSGEFAVNTSQVVKRYWGWYRIPIPTFKPGETIYFNLKNSPGGCYPTCNVFWQFGFPQK